MLNELIEGYFELGREDQRQLQKNLALSIRSPLDAMRILMAASSGEYKDSVDNCVYLLARIEKYELMFNVLNVTKNWRTKFIKQKGEDRYLRLLEILLRAIKMTDFHVMDKLSLFDHKAFSLNTIADRFGERIFRCDVIDAIAGLADENNLPAFPKIKTALAKLSDKRDEYVQKYLNLALGEIEDTEKNYLTWEAGDLRIPKALKPFHLNRYDRFYFLVPVHHKQLEEWVKIIKPNSTLKLTKNRNTLGITYCHQEINASSWKDAIDHGNGILLVYEAEGIPSYVLEIGISKTVCTLNLITPANHITPFCDFLEVQAIAKYFLKYNFVLNK